MKYVKTYESWGKDVIIDVREFFSNLKKISYFFKDYKKFNNIFQEIGNILENTRIPMTYFGFANSSESFYSPIIDKVTSELHRIFPLILSDDYQKIYDWCNEKSIYNYFEKDTKNSIYSRIKTHMSEVIADALSRDDFKPYMEIKFWLSREQQDDYKKYRDIVKKITDDSQLNSNYNFRIYSTDTVIKITIIAKERIEFNSEQLSEIEKAKEFGQEKYEYLMHRIENKDVIDVGNKYNL